MNRCCINLDVIKVNQCLSIKCTHLHVNEICNEYQNQHMNGWVSLVDHTICAGETIHILLINAFVFWNGTHPIVVPKLKFKRKNKIKQKKNEIIWSCHIYYKYILYVHHLNQIASIEFLFKILDKNKRIKRRKIKNRTKTFIIIIIIIINYVMINRSIYSFISFDP